jgi:hypothetical protein
MMWDERESTIRCVCRLLAWLILILASLVVVVSIVTGQASNIVTLGAFFGSILTAVLMYAIIIKSSVFTIELASRLPRCCMRFVVSRFRR